MTTEGARASECTLALPQQSGRERELVCGEDGSSSPITQISALCSAVLTVYLPGIPVQSVSEVCTYVLYCTVPVGCVRLFCPMSKTSTQYY